MCVSVYDIDTQGEDGSPYLGYPEGISSRGGISGSPHGRVLLRSRWHWLHSEGF